MEEDETLMEYITSQVKRTKERSLENTSIKGIGRGSKTKRVRIRDRRN